VITVIEGRLLAKKRKIANEKKVAKKHKKHTKTPIPEPETPNNSIDKCSK
jgi:hypothetical protein